MIMMVVVAVPVIVAMVMPMVMTVIMTVVVMMVVIVLTMGVLVRMAVPDTGFAVSTSTIRTHQLTSRSFIFISSPPTTVSLCPLQSGQGSYRLAMVTFFSQSMHQASPGGSSISSRA